MVPVPADQSVYAWLDGGHDRLGENVLVVLQRGLGWEGVQFGYRFTNVIIVGEQVLDEVLGNGLLFFALVLVDARSGFAVVTVVCKRSVFGEGWGGEHAVVNIWILFFQRAFHVAPSVDHRRLAVTEALGVIVAEVNGSDLVLVIQILEELHVFFGHIVVVVGFLAIFAEEQFTLLIIQTLIDGAVGVAVEVEAGLRHLAAVGFGELLGDLDEFVPCGRNVASVRPASLHNVLL